MKLIFQAILALGIGFLVATTPAAEAATSGSGRMGTEKRAVSDFEAIAQDGAIDLIVRQTGKEGVEVSAEDNLLPLIETVVENRTLQVRFKRGERLRGHRNIRVTVDVIRLSAVAMAGSGDVQIEGVKTPSLKVALSGSSDARLLRLDTDALEVRISGSGDVLAEGRAGQVKLSIAGSGDAELADLVADDVSVRIAGSGDANVTANKSLDVSVAGSGDVRYGGMVASVKSSIAGSGSIGRR
jgi:hypothetical protein